MPYVYATHTNSNTLLISVVDVDSSVTNTLLIFKASVRQKHAQMQAVKSFEIIKLSFLICSFIQGILCNHDLNASLEPFLALKKQIKGLSSTIL